jgi:hypothetical protein
MDYARHDANNKPTIIGVSSVDGETLVPIATDPITGALLIDIVDTTSAVSPVLRSTAKHDVNEKHTMLGWNGTDTQALTTHAGYLAVQFN